MNSIKTEATVTAVDLYELPPSLAEDGKLREPPPVVSDRGEWRVKLESEDGHIVMLRLPVNLRGDESHPRLQGTPTEDAPYEVGQKVALSVG